MFSKLIRLIISAFQGSGKYTSNQEGADIIKRLVEGRAKYRYEWDHFESVTEENPSVNLAIELSHHYARTYPARVRKQYCGKDGALFFIAIANALGNDQFDNLDHNMVLQSLRQGNVPDEVKQILLQNKPGPNEEHLADRFL
jgi:hypothetical protein